MIFLKRRALMTRFSFNYKTASGIGSLVLEKCSETFFKQFKLLGNSVQVTTKGVNLIPFPYVDKDMTKKGVTFTVKEDGGIKVYGTSSESVVFVLAIIDYGKESIFNNSTGNGKIISGGKDNVSIEYHGVTKKTYLSIEQGKAVNTIIYPQLQNGSVATPYEQYTGGKPSPSPEFPQEIKSVGEYNSDTGKYDVDVIVSRKNLLDISACDDGKVLDGNGDIINNANALLTDFIPCFPNTQFGNKLMDYEPYKEPQTIKLSLDQPLRGIGEHKDVITKDGVVRRVYEQKLKKEQVSINEYNWQTKFFRCFVTNEKKIDSSENCILMSNISKKFNIYGGIDTIYWVISEEEIRSIGVTEKDSRGMAFEKIKTFVDNNNIVVQYPLEEPIIEPLTEESKKALESLYTNDGTTIITVDGGEVEAGIEVEYAVKE